MSFPRYQSYKDSGVEWLGEVPGHWEVKRLRHIASIKKGRLPGETSPIPAADTDLPYLSMEFLRGESECSAYVAESPNLIRAENGDILLIWDGSNAGEFFRAKQGVVSSTVALIEPENVGREFLFFVCKAHERRIKDQTIGMGIPHVASDELRSSAIPCPDLAEQSAIAEFLARETGKIDELVAEQRRLMELLKEKRQAVISHAVTRGLNPAVPLKCSGSQWLSDIPEHWTVVSVRSLIRRKVLSLQDGNHGESHPKASEFTSSGIPFLMAGDMDNGAVDLESCNFITEVRASELRISPALAGDVLLSHKGNQLGAVAMIPDEMDFPFIVLRPQLTYYRIEQTSIERAFLVAVLQSKPFQDQLWFFASVQSTRPYVGITTQRELRFALPSMD